jgi:tetratricopeptide (TPR) repeat protein/predicted Ser/Thr protein kinase
MAHALTSLCPRCGTANLPQADFCMACAHALTGRPPAPALAHDGSESTAAWEPRAGTAAGAAGPRAGAGPVDAGPVAPAAGQDETVMLPATQPVGTAGPDDVTAVLPPAASRLTPPRATPGHGRPGRAATPFTSRMSLLSSLADAASTTFLNEGLEIAGRYRVKRLIGKGGMGVVYLVHDMELERDVALKVIRSDIASSPASLERFKREIQLSSKVTHHNVLRVYDLGESEGVKFLTMEYVQGEDLSDVVKRDGRLPFPRVMHYFRQICAGLGAAHEEGVIHRDLKPQNVMIDPTDRVLLTDFGLATVAESSSAARSGAIMGTPYYMSPEQVRGEELDRRSDIYALGIMLYEQLTGAIPFAGGSVTEVMKRRLTDTPRPVAELNRDLPVYIRKVIDKCLATDRDQRYASCDEILKDIYDATEGKRRRRQTAAILSLAATVVIGAVGASGWYVYRQRQAELAKNRPAVSVLVADFADRTDTPVFKGTLEQALAGGMEGASFVNAFSRSTARQIADEQIGPGSPLDVAAARLVSAREGIKIVLAGTVEREGTGYAVKVDAIDPAVDKVLSTTRVTAASEDQVLAAVGRAAAKLRGALGDTTPESARIAAAETVTAASLPALQAYVQAQEFAARREDQKALEQFQRAIDIDPNFGRAYAGMGVLYYNMKDPERAQAAYDKALELLDRMSDREKYRTLGSYYLGMALNYEKAVETYEKLVELYPADDVAHANLSLAYLYTGDVQRALTQVREVLKLNPRSTSDRYNLAIQLVYAGDFEGAIKEGARAIKESPTYEQPYLPVALGALFLDDISEARATYQRVEALSPFGGSLGRLGRADLMLYRGQYREALSILQQSEQADEKAGNTALLGPQHVALAESLLALGRKPQAIAAALEAVGRSRHESVRVPAALVLVQAGRDADAERIAVEMENTLQAHMAAYAQLVRAAVAMRDGRHGRAVELFRDSLKRRDTWLGRLMLGQLYVDTGRYTEAIGELDTCLKRHGETGDVFFYDFPTARYLPPLYYYLARAQEALGSADARKNFQKFLALRGDALPPDPLAADAAKRLGS